MTHCPRRLKPLGGIIVHKDVARFDVPVDHAATMNMFQPATGFGYPASDWRAWEVKSPKIARVGASKVFGLRIELIARDEAIVRRNLPPPHPCKDLPRSLHP